MLPFAFATELMAEAAQAAFPDLHVVAVRDVQLLKGIAADPVPMPMIITVSHDVHTSDSGLAEVRVDITTPSMNPSMRYRSVVQMSSQAVEPPSFDVPSWTLGPLSKTLNAAYRDWTFHGPRFQCVTDIAGFSAESILGTIYSPSATAALSNAGRPEWIIDPFVFDAALQLLLIWSRAQHDKTALPARIQSFSRYGPLTDQRLTCYVAVESLAGGHALKSDVYFVNANGRLVGLLRGAEASCTNALNRLTAAAEVRDRTIQ